MMKPMGQRTTPIVVLALLGAAWLTSPALTEAATTNDTFELKSQSKEFCQGNPKFFENSITKVQEGITLTFTRDVNGDSDLSDVKVKINNAGVGTDWDAFVPQGLAFVGNTAQSTLEFAMSGVNGNTNHFLTLRGKAALDKAGNVTKVTGTFIAWFTGTFTVKPGQPSASTECFSSGTFGTGKKQP